MGLLNKRKSGEGPASVLSEAEIQKKLYGEFRVETSSVASPTRDHFKTSRDQDELGRESLEEKQTPQDLFSLSPESVASPVVPERPVHPEVKQSEGAVRYVPLHDFEKKSSVSAQTPHTKETSSSTRLPRLAESKIRRMSSFFSASVHGIHGFIKDALDPKRVLARRYLFWGGAILAVLVLFWGVNALNSQREQAMRTRYKIPHENVTTPVQAAVPMQAVTTRVEPAKERPVVITPAPIRSKRNKFAERAESANLSGSGSYVIQVVTYPDRQIADQLVTNLGRAQFHAFVEENRRPSGRIFYVVFIGGFRTEATAQAQLAKFRVNDVARPFRDAFVKSRKS